MLSSHGQGIRGEARIYSPSTDRRQTDMVPGKTTCAIPDSVQDPSLLRSSAASSASCKPTTSRCRDYSSSTPTSAIDSTASCVSICLVVNRQLADGSTRHPPERQLRSCCAEPVSSARLLTGGCPRFSPAHAPGSTLAHQLHPELSRDRLVPTADNIVELVLSFNTLKNHGSTALRPAQASATSMGCISGCAPSSVPGAGSTASRASASPTRPSSG